MAGNILRKSLSLTLCIFIAYFIFYRKDFTPKNSHINRGTCVIPELTNFDQFYDYFDKPKAACTNKEQVGGKIHGRGILDGDKWVCFDSGFIPDNCVVYSFGISNEWSFDDAMDRRYCKVFSFDPTMGAKDHKRSQRISFFNLGISNYSGSMSMKKLFKVDRYRGIVDMLGHSSKIIDYLKMDIEGSEIAVLKDILDNDLKLLDNVQQIGMEVHPGKPASTMVSQHLKDFWEIFHRLDCLGWRLLTAEINQVSTNHFKLNGTLRSHCYEVVWIRA